VSSPAPHWYLIAVIVLLGLIAIIWIDNLGFFRELFSESFNKNEKRLLPPIFFSDVSSINVAKLALIASILLGNFFGVLAIEGFHWQHKLSDEARLYFVNAPLIMSFILALVYFVSIPALVSNIIISSNKDRIQILRLIGAKRGFIADQIMKMFFNIMIKVSAQSIIIEFVTYSILVMTISSFTDFILVNFPAMIGLTLVSIALFIGLAGLITRYQALRYLTHVDLGEL
jgi:hypothetical protein